VSVLEKISLATGRKRFFNDERVKITTLSHVLDHEAGEKQSRLFDLRKVRLMEGFSGTFFMEYCVQECAKVFV
jgi:hypothetical protein